MHVVLLLCNGPCNVNKGCIYKKKSIKGLNGNQLFKSLTEFQGGFCTGGSLLGLDVA